MASNNVSRGSRSSRASLESEWNIYDKQHPTIRRVLQQAVINWSAVGVARFMRSSGRQPYEMAKIVAKWDREAIKKHNAITQQTRRTK